MNNLLNLENLDQIDISENNVDNQFLNVHSGAIHIEHKLTLKQRLAWFYMLFKARNYLDTEDTHKISLTELKKAINYTSGNNKILKEELKQLRRTEVEWNIFLKDKTEIWGVSSLFTDIEIINGTCEYSYSPKLKKRFFNPSMYVKLNLMISRKFRSKNTLAIYTLAIDYLQVKNNFGEKNLSLCDMRKYLGLEQEQYNRETDLYKHILKKAEKEINKDSDIILKIIPIRAERSKIIGFKLQMSIREEYLKFYKSKKFSEESNNQLSLVDIIDSSEDKKEAVTKTTSVNKALIKVENHDLKKYFAKHKISITTDTVQKKLKGISDELGEENLESYLSFLMAYSDQEYSKGNIKSLSGFFIGLIKDDTQIENYIFNLGEKEKKAQERKIKLESLLEIKLKSNYENYLTNDFETYLTENIDSLENKFIELVKNKIKSGMAHDYVIVKLNKGKINKNLITKVSLPAKQLILNELRDSKSELDYEIKSFSAWKEETLTAQYMASLKEEIESE